MTNLPKRQAVVAGLGGNVAGMFYETLGLEAVPFGIEAVAAARPEHVGKKLGSVIPSLAAKFNDVPIISLESAVNNTDAEVVFSALRTEEAEEYEVPLARDRLVVTNSAAHRTNPDAVLANPYVSAGKIADYLEGDRPWHIVATGNCVAQPFAIGLAALKRLGIEASNVVTLQGWSGSGADAVPEKYAGRVVPFSEIYEGDDEKEKIETEPNQLLGTTGHPTNIDIHATPHRGPWVRGHHILAGVKFRDETSPADIYEHLTAFRAPGCLAKYSGNKLLPSTRPIFAARLPILQMESGVLTPSVEPIPMEVRVRLKAFDPRSKKRALLEMFSDNLSLGAAGSGVMTALYAYERGLL